MKKQIKILSILAIIILSSVSCSNPNNPNTNNEDTTKWKDKSNYSLLQQIWAGSASVFKYINNEQAYTAALNSYIEYPKTMKYTLTIESITWISETEGIMYGKCNYALDSTLTKKYMAIAFRNLTAGSVELSEDSLNNKKYAETLEEAKTVF
ncbi:hypothetical protein, partial [Brachyspira hampsonii]